MHPFFPSRNWKPAGILEYCSPNERVIIHRIMFNVLSFNHAPRSKSSMSFLTINWEPHLHSPGPQISDICLRRASYVIESMLARTKDIMCTSRFPIYNVDSVFSISSTGLSPVFCLLAALSRTSAEFPCAIPTDISSSPTTTGLSALMALCANGARKR